LFIYLNKTEKNNSSFIRLNTIDISVYVLLSILWNSIIETKQQIWWRSISRMLICACKYNLYCIMQQNNIINFHENTRPKVYVYTALLIPRKVYRVSCKFIPFPNFICVVYLSFNINISRPWCIDTCGQNSGDWQKDDM